MDLTLDKLHATMAEFGGMRAAKFGGWGGVGFASYALVGVDHMVERKQVRFPKSRKRRIRRKWAKKDKNFAMVPQQHFFIMEREGVIVAHPDIIDQIRRSALATR